jgi:hypothetical protein
MPFNRKIGTLINRAIIAASEAPMGKVSQKEKEDLVVSKAEAYAPMLIKAEWPKLNMPVFIVIQRLADIVAHINIWLRINKI